MIISAALHIALIASLAQRARLSRSEGEKALNNSRF